MSETISPSNPPRKNRFQKGKSGNPNGRPKKKKEESHSPYDVVLDKKLTVTVGGVEQELSMEAAVQQQTLKSAFDGNQTARREVMKWIEKRDKEREKLGERASGVNEIRLEGPDPNNVVEPLKLLGVVTREPSRELDGSGVEHLLIETWAAQMALDRCRRGEPLTEQNIALINCEVRDHQLLNWPRSLTHDE